VWWRIDYKEVINLVIKLNGKYKDVYLEGMHVCGIYAEEEGKQENN